MDGATKRRTMASITTERRVKNIFVISYCDKYNRQTRRAGWRSTSPKLPELLRREDD